MPCAGQEQEQWPAPAGHCDHVTDVLRFMLNPMCRMESMDEDWFCIIAEAGL